MFKKVRTPIHIRFKDIDAMGHVNNAVYITFFEEGRKAFIDEVLGITNTSEYSMILATINCEYVKPLCLTDNALLEICVADIGKKSFRFKYSLFSKEDGGVLFAKGESVMVTYNYNENHSIAIPPEFLKKMKDYIETNQAGIN